MAMAMAMASDECSFSRHDYNAKAIAMCATILVIVAAFLHGSRFLRNRRRQRGDLQHQQQHQKFEINEGSSSSGDSEAAPEYEVFLSFRGSDIRNTFTSHLYYGLTDAGICTFMDNEELRVGEEIGPKLMKSIKQSKIGMPIFSADYASSKWCLMEVAEMVKSMKEEGKQLIMPIFYNVSVDDVQHQTGSYANSFSKHEKRFGREKVEEWRYALREVVKLKGLELAKMANGDEGAFIKYVVARVIRELKKSYLEMASILVGIEDRVEELVNKLQVGMDDVRFLGIWGMGGIGKTTLAKYVYNQVMHKFECHSFLKDIRETARYPKGLQSLQSKLVADILRRDKEDYFDVEAGVSVLKERLRGKKALVLLDDVDHVDQLKSLAADVSWFGRGSRIIITTREKNVLDLSHVNDLYPVESLTKALSFELFCMHAFGDRSPRPDLAEEAREIVNITGGLPLALEVTGSSLSTYVGKKSVWQDTIEKLKEKPDMKVQDKLKISYKSLDRQQREIFLDIACFFIGMDVRMVTPMWNDAKFFPILGIEVLQVKSLIKIGDDHTIWMHDQLRDLGRSIVEDMEKERGQRSRIWQSEDAFHLLVNEKGTNKVHGIRLEGYHFEEEDDHLSDIMFSKMQNLRILELGNARLGGNFHRLLHELKWLSWHRKNIYPPKHLVLKNLIALDLSWSKINESWIGWSMIKFGSKLKVLNLSKCSMRKTPDFSGFPSLEILIMENCKKLECIDESMGLLKKLILLNLNRCFLLRKLPEQLDSMESLTELFIDWTRVEELPILGGMKKLELISANQCLNLREVPASIGSLANLKKISLRGCDQLSELPESIGKLTSLVELDLTHCSSLKRLPDFHRDMHYCLEELMLIWTKIDGLPSNLGSLKKLKVLKASREDLEDCIEIPDDVSNLSSLRELELAHIKRLPGSLSALSCLQTFQLSECWNLPALPKLPSCLVKLIVDDVSSKQEGGFPNLESLVNLKELRLDGDFEVKEGCLDHMCKLEKLRLRKVKIRSLPEHISSFSHLKKLYIDFCECIEIPDDVSNLSSLREMELAYIKSLPVSLSALSCLETLPMLPSCLVKLIVENVSSKQEGGFPNLESLVNLKELKLWGDFEVKEGCLDHMCKLEKLDLRKVKIRSLPEHISSFSHLKKLYIDFCEELGRVPTLPPNLWIFRFGGCGSFEKLPDLSNLKQLSAISINCPDVPEEIPGLMEYLTFSTSTLRDGTRLLEGT